jgi:hypothetical protein
MAEPSISLTNLRRMICRELKMPFFLRYKNGFLDADSGTTTTLVDTALTQKDKFWNNAWLYRVASQEAALILNFTSLDDTLTLETPITTFTSGDDYEIHNLWNAYEIHEAINQAIRDTRRVFIETITDELLVVQQDKMSYSLADLSRDPFVISQVWLEQPTSVARGTLVSATATTVTLPAGYLPSALGGDTWYISIYDGTGKGGLRALTALTVGGVQASVATWDTNPDSTSKFALWNGSEETNDWYSWNALRYDSSKEFPDVLYFSIRPTDFLGMRIRVEYASLPVELSLEADTTKIPTSYLLPAAVSKLHGHKIGDNRADRDLHFGEARRYQDMADAFLARNAPHRPDMSMLRQHSNSYQPDPMNPLNW